MTRDAKSGVRVPLAMVSVAGVLASVTTALAALPPVPVPLANPITEQKRLLGKILFWDEQLSTANTVACATCHQMGTGGSDGRPRVRNPGVDHAFNTPDDVFGSAGVIRSDVDDDMVRDTIFNLGVQVTGRSAPSAINAGFAPSLFWDGRATGQFVDPQTGAVALQANGALESQSSAPPMSDVEMAHQDVNWDQVAAKLATARPLDLATNHPSDVAGALADHPSYLELFRRAFGDPAITARRIAFAIATYERTLVSDQTPFDRFRAGVPGAMTQPQIDGLQQFQNHRCSACHSLVNDMTTDFSFRNIGLRPTAEDVGRQGVTNNAADRGKFKVPNLRNAGLKTNFMHNGMFTNLTDVIRFYARAPGAPAQFPDNRDPLMDQIVPLPPQDAGVIQDFIQNALTDPRVAAQTAPFDHPTLFGARAADQTTSQGGGVPGSGGTVPRVVVLAPSMLGNMDYRIGLDGALGGAQASLGVSTTPPTNGRISSPLMIGSVLADGIGAGQGMATLHWPLGPGVFPPGTVLFAQWFVTDPGAAGGVALSNVVRIPIFCGSGGCPPCDADLNQDGNTDQDDVLFLINMISGGFNSNTIDPDFNHDGNADQDDVTALINVIAGGPCPA